MRGNLIKHSIGGVELDGFSTLLPSDRRCVLHFAGLAGNFYEASFILLLAERLREADIGFVSGNTRGHDYLADAIVADESEARGGARAILVEYVEDMRAWKEWAERESKARMVLQAHSASAVCLANLALEDRDERWDGAIYLSPADMDTELASSATARRFEELKAEASADPNSLDLMSDDALPGYPLSKRVYDEFVRRDSGWGVLRWKEQDRSCEVFSTRRSLVTFGSEEASTDLELESVLDRWRAAGAETAVVANAGHSYKGQEQQLVSRILEFVSNLEGN